MSPLCTGLSRSINLIISSKVQTVQSIPNVARYTDNFTPPLVAFPNS
jgi:hypothetical protein